MAKIDLWLEMEIGITGGEEDGVDNTGVKPEELYTKPEQVRSCARRFHPWVTPLILVSGLGRV